MTGYTKTKTFTTGATIIAQDFTTEFNNVSVAFDESTGHTHNGDADSGAYVPLISSADTFTKITTTEATNQLNFYTNVSGAAALQLSFKDGVIEPNADSDVDIGTTAKRFKDLYVDSATVTGTVTADSLAVQTSSGNALASVTSTTGKSILQVTSTFEGTVADQEASIEIGAHKLAHIDLKTPNTDDYDLRIEHSEPSNLSMINSLTDNLFLRSGAKVALQHGGANTKLETTATGVDVTGGVTTDYIDLTGGESTTTTGTIACKMIVLNDSSNDLSDGSTIFTEENSVDSNDSSLIIQQSDDAADYIKLRLGSGGAGTLVDVLTASTTGIDVTGTVAANKVKLGNNEFIELGNNSELKLHFNGTDSYIAETGSGNLRIAADDFRVQNGNATVTLIQANEGGSTALHWGGGTSTGVKLETKQSGVDVTGAITVSGTVDGRDIAADGLVLDAIEAGADVTDTTNVVAALTAGTNIAIAGDGTISSTDTTYSTATSSTAGLVKIGYVENAKNYPVELSSDKMFVNVPWTDSQTAGTGLSLAGGAFSVNASQTQVTSVGALNAGTITSGFGSINVGTDSINTTGFVNAGTVNFPSHTNDTLKITSSIDGTASHLEFWISDDLTDTFKFMTSQYAVGGGVEAELLTLKATATGAGKALLTVDGQTNTLGLKLTSSQVVTSIDTDLTGVSAAHDTLPTALATKTYVDAQTAAASAGDITSVVAGDGLTGGATSGVATVNVVGGVGIVANANEVVLDLSELTMSEDNAHGDFFAVVDSSNLQKKLTKANIALSEMNNDSGWTTNTGTVTAVTVGTGLDVSNGTTAPALSLDFTEFSDMTADVAGTTEVILNNAGTESRKAISEIKLSTFNNDLTFANTDTTYTAGTGLTLSASNEFSVNVAQSGITSLGTLSALNVTGDLTLEALYPTGTGNLFLGTISGGSAVATAAQYNTGVGNATLGAVTTATFNTAVGAAALQSLTTGTNNVAFGLNASKSLVSAASNSSFGVSALHSLVNGSSNTALGTYAGYSLTTASGNVLVGASAGYDLTSGANNIVLGNNAARNGATLTNCVVIGQDAGYNLGSQGGIIAIGHDAMKGSATAGAFTGGEACIAIGENALESITTAERCTAIGDQAGMDITTGGSNTLVGQLAGTDITTGTFNVAIGDNAGRSITTAEHIIAIGSYAGRYLGSNSVAVGAFGGRYQKGQNNTFLGADAGQGDAAYTGTGGTKNTAIGSNTFKALTAGSYNVAVGSEALVAGTACNYNTAMGASALQLLTTGAGNTAIGYLTAGNTSTNVGSSTSIGYAAGMFTGTGSVSVGYTAGYNQDGISNTFIGRQAGYGSSTYRNSGATPASENTGIGYRSFYSLAGGLYNTAIGRTAGFELTTGDHNTLLGRGSGYNLTTGSSNVLVGNLAGASVTTGSNNIVIGADSGSALTVANNVTIIGSATGSSPNLNSLGYAGAVAISSNDPSFRDPLLLLEKNGNVSIPATNGVWHSQYGGFKFQTVSGTKTLKWARGSSTTSSIKALEFYASTGSVIGSLQATSTSISISYTSDYRLKENVSPLTGSIDRLKALKPCTFNFLSEPTRQEEGFIAHEVQEVVPQAVVGVKDAVDENGDAELQGVDPSRIVVILTGALQEAIEKIEQLEERISALEA